MATFKFAHNNFNVLDLERSMKFYEEALGLKEVTSYSLPMALSSKLLNTLQAL